MATLTRTAPTQPAPDRPRGLRLFEPGGARTLDQAVTTVLEAAPAGPPGECLVCGQPVQARSDERVECSSCGSALE